MRSRRAKRPLRSRKAKLSLAVVALVAVAALGPAIAESVTTPVEAVNEGGGIYGETHRWLPSAETVIAGSVVTFRNSTEVPHGVRWVSAPSTPECSSGVPVGTTAAASGTKWSGTCTFSQAGTYTFYCTVHGSEMSGTITVPGTPKAKTEAASEVSQRAATLKGSIEPQGEATEYRFQYGTASVSEHTTLTSPLGVTDFASHPVAKAIGGLAPGTEYKAQLVAVYGSGKTEALGGETKFTTPAATAPTASTGAASPGETQATLKGTVLTGGEATEYDFEYGTSEGYGQVTEVKTLSAESSSQSVSALAVGLTAGTVYHFRLHAKNALGTSDGLDGMFTTAKPSSEPPPSPPSPEPPAPGPPAAAPGPAVQLVPSGLANGLEGTPRPMVEGSLALKAPKHGSSVRGSIEVSPAGAGARLEVDLLAPGASLSRRTAAKQVLVGRLTRPSVSAGRISFSVALNGRGKSALRRRHKLALTVKVTLTPPGGGASTLTRRIVLHA